MAETREADNRARTVVVAVFLANGVAHLAATQAAWQAGAVATKVLITVILGVYVALRVRAPLATRLLAALGFAMAGDIALEFQGKTAFLVGIGFFALAQLAYLWTFSLVGRALPRPAIAAYAAVWLAAAIWLAGTLESPLREAAIGYGALLVAMAARAWRAGMTAAIGGAVFVVSDAVLAARALVDLPIGPSWLVMVTYMAAQLLIVLGVTSAVSQQPARPALR